MPNKEHSKLPPPDGDARLTKALVMMNAIAIKALLRTHPDPQSVREVFLSLSERYIADIMASASDDLFLAVLQRSQAGVLSELDRPR